MSGTPPDSVSAGEEAWVDVKPRKEGTAGPDADSGSDGSWEVAGADGQAQVVALSNSSEVGKPSSSSEADGGATPECDDLWILLAEGDQSGEFARVSTQVRERWASRVAQRAARAAQLAAPKSNPKSSEAAAEGEESQGPTAGSAAAEQTQVVEAREPSQGLPGSEADAEATLGRLRKPMDAYSHMVYWKIQVLLQQSYGTACSLDAAKMKGLALEQYRQLVHDSVLEKRQRARKLEFSEQEKSRAEAQIARFLQLESPEEIATAPLESLTTLTPATQEPTEEAPQPDGTETETPTTAPAPDLTSSDAPQSAAAGEASPDDLSGVMNVWETLDQFAFAETDDSDGKVLVPGIPPSQTPSVASKEEFIARFHQRTGGVFTSFDWTNLRIIGGLMPACLIADDEAFAGDCFAETDVDVYVVGLTGSAFKERVASAISGLYSSARSRGFRAVVVKTPCTISISLRGPRGPLPNIQMVTSPFTTTHHLLYTTDIDITGFAFDGEILFATPTACEAVRYRRNVARPEKYNIRGEFSTESRLLKYAMRGFRVVDTGLPADLEVPEHKQMETIAAKAAAALLEKALTGTGELSLDHTYNKHEQEARASGVTGAHLLLLAQRYPGLQQLLLYDVPPMPAGMADARLLGLLRGCDATDGYEHMLGDGQKTRKPRKAMLKLLFPSRLAVTASEALKDVRERDPDARRTVRSWYTGLEQHLKGSPSSTSKGPQAGPKPWSQIM